MRRREPSAFERVEEASKCFLRAASCALEWTSPGTKRTALGEALFWAALGMLRLAQSDPNEYALNFAMELIEAAREKKNA